MTTDAAQNLSNLLSFSGEVQTVEEIRAAQQRAVPDRGNQPMPDSDEEGKAGLGLGEGFASAVVGTVLFGPIGGIVLGGAQAILKRKADQSILDRFAGEQSAMTDAVAIYDDQMTALRDSAKTPEDLEQLSVMEANKSAALELMTSGSDELKAQGLGLFAGYQTDLLAYTNQQETQSIANTTAIEKDKRDLGIVQYNRYEGLQDDFTAQSAGYLERQQAGNTAMNALQSGTPADLHAAMILFNKTLDPNSAVLGEERTAITEMGGWLDSAYNFFGEKYDGSQLNANQRRDLGGAISRILDESAEFQSAREGEFSERVDLAELPAKYHDRFRLIENTPAAEPLNIPDDVLTSFMKTSEGKKALAAQLSGDPRPDYVQLEKTLQGLSSGYTDFINGLKDEANAVGGFLSEANTAMRRIPNRGTN